MSQRLTKTYDPKTCPNLYKASEAYKRLTLQEQEGESSAWFSAWLRAHLDDYNFQMSAHGVTRRSRAAEAQYTE